MALGLWRDWTRWETSADDHRAHIWPRVNSRSTGSSFGSRRPYDPGGRALVHSRWCSPVSLAARGTIQLAVPHSFQGLLSLSDQVEIEAPHGPIRVKYADSEAEAQDIK